MDGVDSIREELRGSCIIFDKLDDDTGIFDHVDALVNVSRDNERVQHVFVCLTADPDAQRYAIWDKIAEVIGNLQALRMLSSLDSSF